MRRIVIFALMLLAIVPAAYASGKITYGLQGRSQEFHQASLEERTLLDARILSIRWEPRDGEMKQVLYVGLATDCEEGMPAGVGLTALHWVLNPDGTRKELLEQIPIYTPTVDYGGEHGACPYDPNGPIGPGGTCAMPGNACYWDISCGEIISGCTEEYRQWGSCSTEMVENEFDPGTEISMCFCSAILSSEIWAWCDIHCPDPPETVTWDLGWELGDCPTGMICVVDLQFCPPGAQIDVFTGGCNPYLGPDPGDDPCLLCWDYDETNNSNY